MEHVDTLHINNNWLYSKIISNSQMFNFDNQFFQKWISSLSVQNDNVHDCWFKVKEWNYTISEIIWKTIYEYLFSVAVNKILLRWLGDCKAKKKRSSVYTWKICDTASLLIDKSKLYVMFRNILCEILIVDRLSASRKNKSNLLKFYFGNAEIKVCRIISSIQFMHLFFCE